MCITLKNVCALFKPLTCLIITVFNSFQSKDEIYSSKYHYKRCIVIPVHASETLIISFLTKKEFLKSDNIRAH